MYKFNLLTLSRLKFAKRENLERLAKYLRLHAYEDMSTRQLTKLIKWRVTR